MPTEVVDGAVVARQGSPRCRVRGTDIPVGHWFHSDRPALLISTRTSAATSPSDSACGLAANGTVHDDSDH